MTEEMLEKFKRIVNKVEGNRKFTESIAEALGEATSTVSHKNSEMSSYADWEIELLRKKYGMTDEEVVDIFIRGRRTTKN